MKKVAMIGVGKLGQDCAEVMATQNNVVGFDIEPRNPEFPMTNTIQEAVTDRNIIFIAAPTPHDPIYGGETPTSHLPNKDFDYTIVKNILSEVNKYVNNSQLVVLISTVLPGTVRSQLRQCITNARFVYNPYLIAMGTIKYDMTNPEMVIIGTEDGSLTGDAKELIDFYEPLMQNNPRYEVGTWDEAESIKIFYNTFISTKLALVNMIQDVAEKNGNINVDVVTEALAKSTYRIMGPAYMKAGLGDAGACHPRDNIALRYLAEKLELNYDLFDAIMKAREVQAENMALKCLRYGNNVTIVGKAYKPGVHYTNGSASMLIGHYIEKHGGNVNYYDIHTNDLDLKTDWTNVYLIGYWEQYVREINFPESAIVVDPWRTITNDQHKGTIVHYGNTRNQKNSNIETKKKIFDDRPDEQNLSAKKTIFYKLIPELYQYDDVIHFIYAGQQPGISILLRSSESIANEIDTFSIQGKQKFIFFGAEEGVSTEILKKIHEVYSKLETSVQCSDFIYVVGSLNGEHIYYQYCEQNNIKNRISIISTHYFEFMAQKLYGDFEYIGEYQEFPKSHRNKKFLCFNKVSRLHRVDLLERMLAYGLLTDSFYSFEGDEEWKNKIDDLDPNLYPNIKANKNLFPIRLNISAHRSNPVDITPDDLPYFNQSYFSIVTETSFYSKNKLENQNLFHHMLLEDCMFLSEKIYKCFVAQHPFILLARPHSLKYLRERGYKTFAPFIDETYDSIENDDERFNAIFDEILRLSKLDTYELQNFTKNVKEIIEHNKMNFFAINNFVASTNILSYFENLPSSGKIYEHDVSTSYFTPKIEVPKTSVIPNNHTSLEFKVYENYTINDEDKEEYPIRLQSGLFYKIPKYLEKKEIRLLESLMEIIESTGKNRYQNCLNYFSGTGILGYELLGFDIIQKILFTDYCEEALAAIKYISNENNLDNFTQTYRCIKIDNLPNTQQFDIVIGYPPCFDSESEFLSYKNINNSNVENEYRKNVDHNYYFMNNFFKNILKFSTPDVKIFLVIENIEKIWFKIMKIAGDNGFRVQTTKPIEELNLILANFVVDSDHNPENKPVNNNLATVTQYNYSDIYNLGFPQLEKITYNENDFLYTVPPISISSEITKQIVHEDKFIEYSRDLCSEAYKITDELANIVKTTGTHQQYSNMLNWCSGTGILGFKLLLTNIVEKCSFMDNFTQATDRTLHNINSLDLNTRTEVFNTSAINFLQTKEKYDLVIGFPPGSAGYEGYVQFMLSHHSPDQFNELIKNNILNYSRMLVDQDFLILKEFFKNIGNFLRPHADVYIIVNGESEHFDIWAAYSNLYRKQTTKLSNLPHKILLHYTY